MGSKSHKDLDVWKKGIDIVDMVYDLAADLPKNELYGLVIVKTAAYAAFKSMLG